MPDSILFLGVGVISLIVFTLSLRIYNILAHKQGLSKGHLLYKMQEPHLFVDFLRGVCYTLCQKFMIKR